MTSNRFDVVSTNPLEAWTKMPTWDKVPDISQKDNLVPPYRLVYRAFELTKPEEVKVVILGQDPYPTRGHANGLAFSISPHVKIIPASLRNVLKEYTTDLGFPIPRNGDLSVWAERGVLLLNTALTTEEKQIGKHLDDWKEFTHGTIRWLSRLSGRRVFHLWGRHARAYEDSIKGKDNIIFTSSHPSPFSATKPNGDYIPFIGSKPFTKTCDALGLSKDFWRL